MKTTLILTRTGYDPVTAWTDIKNVDVDIPFDWVKEGWHIIGALNNET